MKALLAWLRNLKSKDLVSDAVTLSQLPIPIATIASAWESYKAEKERQGTEVLLGELRRGHTTIEEIIANKENAAMVFMLLRAATEGTARLNLKILAKVLRGFAVREEHREEKFAHLAAIIRTLSRTEIVVLAEFYTTCKEVDARGDPKAGNAYMAELTRKLVPTRIRSEDELRAILNALTRTGFVIFPSNVWGAGSHIPTPLLDEVVVLAAFREAVAEDEGEPELAQRV